MREIGAFSIALTSAASSHPNLPGFVCFVCGVYFTARYHYFPEKFSPKLRPRTAYIGGALLILIGILLMFGDILWKLIFGADVGAIR
jgi:hypothetical protein